MRLSPKAGLSLAAMVVATGLGVGAQTNSTARPARPRARLATRHVSLLLQS